MESEGQEQDRCSSGRKLRKRTLATCARRPPRRPVRGSSGRGRSRRCCRSFVVVVPLLSLADMESADLFVPKEEDSCAASEDAGSAVPLPAARRLCVISNAIRKRVRSEYYRIRHSKRQERAVLVKVSLSSFPTPSYLMSLADCCCA